MKKKALFNIMLLLIVVLESGCQMAEVIEKNTEVVEITGKAIDKNTTAVLATTQTMARLIAMVYMMFAIMQNNILCWHEAKMMHCQ